MNRIFIPIFILLLTQSIYAVCSDSKAFWQSKINQSQSLEQFFMDNYECQPNFYKALQRSEKIYFDTVVYPNYLSKAQYQNRWFAMSLANDTDFFKKFTFFNNYFTTHKNSITSKQMQCFQQQRGFQNTLPAHTFYNELNRRGMSHDVSYLYPLIRWAYVNKGIDMTLSAKRVKGAEQQFGIKKGKVGDSEQFARYIALFDEEYESVTTELANKMSIAKLDAYKLLVIITYLESRGNIFAVSKTGAFGPMQLTLHFYMMYGEPNNPFNPKASMIKLANKFVHYNREGRTLDASVIAYKSGSLNKCRNGAGKNSADCKYYHAYKRYMAEMQNMQTKSEISKHMTGKSYFYPELASLKRARNQNGIEHYEPYQYAVLKVGVLGDKARNSFYLSGQSFKSLGKMKRGEIYDLQDIYGASRVGVISDKKVCW